MVSTNLNSNIFGKLSGNARVSLRNAAQVASYFNSAKVEPSHIFIGIVLNKSSLVTRILNHMDIDVSSVLGVFKGLEGFSINVNSSKKRRQLYFSEDSMEILRDAFQFANELSHVYVGTEHIFLSILRNKSFKELKKLKEKGLTASAFHEALLNQATYPIGLLAKPEVSDPVNMGRQSPLAMLGNDLVEAAKKGEFDPLIGRQKELDSMVRILSRRKKNNPIIIGEAGVGKTALVEGLAQRIAKGAVPPPLLNMKIVALDISSIIANSKLRGDIEEKVMGVIQEVLDNPNIIIFIDEIHNILASSVPGSGVDIASVLNPALLKENFRCIGATTTESYTQYFAEDTALARRFQPVKLEEPTLQDTEKILKQTKKLIEKHQKVKISSEAITAAATLSHRYISDRYLPDKAIDLLDEAAATKRMEVECKFKDVSKLHLRYKDLISKKRDAVQRGDLDIATRYRNEEVDLKAQVDKLEKKRSASIDCGVVEVDVDTIRNVVADWTGIPITTLDISESKKLLKLEKILSSSIIGQKEAVNAVAKSIKRARAGISSPDRPWASFLFLGPTGVGKTETAKVLTKEIFGDEEKLIQIDMSEMMEMHSVSKLIGSPPGYVGYREGGQLTEIVRQNPHCVILFDEIEKAHDDVLNILLQILESGHLTDGKGKRVNFKNTIIILTSNIGAEDIVEDRVLGFSEVEVDKEKSDEDIENAYEGMKGSLTRILKSNLKPELINRLDDIVIFRSLTRKDARNIVKLLIEELNERIKEKKIFVSLDDKAITHLVKNGFSLEYGARPLRRIIQDEIEAPLAEWILEKKFDEKKEQGKDLLEVKFTFSKTKGITISKS